MTVKLPYTNMYIKAEYKCSEDLDVFEDDYGEDEMYEDEMYEDEMYEDEVEDDIWEDEEVNEEDEMLQRAIRLETLRAASRKQLEGLSVLEGKLNWTQVASSPPIVTNEAYPGQNGVKRPKKKYIPKKDDRRLQKVAIPAYKPARIRVYLGPEVGIGFEDTYCQDFKNGKICPFGDKCKYLHQYEVKKPEPCRNGDKCKYGTKCKFLHEKVSDVGLCKLGKRCKYENCKFSHDMGLCLAIKNKQVCKYGINCKYSHEIAPKGVPKGILKANPEKPVVRMPNKSPQKPQEDKKHLLCNNMFTVENGQIKVIGVCKFGAKCIFAHALAEVSEKIKNNPTQFNCTDKCKYVTFDLITKKDKDGKDRKTRRYKNNNDSFICRKIHLNERVTDYLGRTWFERKVDATSGKLNGKPVNKM